MMRVRDWPLRVKIPASVLLAILIVALPGGGATYLIALDEIDRLNREILLQDLAASRVLLDTELAVYLRKADVLFNNRGLQAALIRDYSDASMSEVLAAYEDELYDRTSPLVDDLVGGAEMGSGSVELWGVRVSIYSRNETLPTDGRLILRFSDVSTTEWARATIERRGRATWRGPFVSVDEEYISVNRSLRDFDSLSEIGILSIIVPAARVSYLLSVGERTTAASLFLVDSKGSIVSHRTFSSGGEQPRTPTETIGFVPFDAAPGSLISIDDVTYMAAVLPLEMAPWRLVGLLPYDLVKTAVQRVRTTLAILIGLSTAIAILTGLVLSTLTTRRIARVSDKMRLLRIDPRRALPPIAGADEVGRLDAELSTMVSAMNTIADRERAMENRQLSLEVELLQSQINPHMLYNSLTALSWEAGQLQVPQIQDAVERLIRFFRLYLNGGSLITTIRAEAEMVRHYIEVFRHTYQMDVEATVAVDDEVTNARTLNLLLQPIVENALVHGLRPKAGQKALWVHCGSRQGQICLSVRDNGVGIDPDAVATVHGRKPASKTGGLGLTNVARRLDLYFADRASLEIVRLEGGGTKVTIRLPVLTVDGLSDLIPPILRDGQPPES